MKYMTLSTGVTGDTGAVGSQSNGNYKKLCAHEARRTTSHKQQPCMRRHESGADSGKTKKRVRENSGTEVELFTRGEHTPQSSNSHTGNKKVFRNTNQ